MTETWAAAAVPSRRHRFVRAFVLAGCGLILGGPSAMGDTVDGEQAMDATTVDELIEQLREDPVLVQPSMGMGDSELAHDVLSDAAADADMPIYVVLAELPGELAETEQPAEQAAVLFRDELGDGIYHVEFLGTGPYTGAWGAPEDFDLRQAYSELRTAEENGPGEYPRSSALFEAAVMVRAAAAPGEQLPSSVVDDYASQPWAFVPDPPTSMADAEATRWVATLATVIGVLVAGLIVTVGVVRAKPLKARQGDAARPAYEAVPEGIERRAKKHLGDARRRLDELSGDELTTPAGERVSTAVDAAERVVDTGDDLDAVGAYVLALTADREADRMSRPELQTYQPCFINPMHGEAEDTVRVGGSSIDAPVCSACGRKQGAFLSVRKGLRRWVPYVETSTVWARTGYGALVGDLADQVLADRSVRR